MIINAAVDPGFIVLDHLSPFQVSGLIEKLRGQCEGVPEESEEIRERAEKSRVDFLLLVRDLKDEEDLAEEGEEEQERLQVSLISSLFTRLRDTVNWNLFAVMENYFCDTQLG